MATTNRNILEVLNDIANAHGFMVKVIIKVWSEEHDEFVTEFDGYIRDISFTDLFNLKFQKRIGATVGDKYVNYIYCSLINPDFF